MVFIVRNHKKHISHCVVIFIEFRYVTVGSAYLPLDFKELTQNTLFIQNTNVMHLILFIRQIFSSTCFEYQVLIFSFPYSCVSTRH